MKYKIEKNTVQETLILPLYSRSLMQRFGALEVAMRQNDLTWEVRDYLKKHPKAAAACWATTI